MNKAYNGKNENVTHVNIFVGGTFPFPQVIFMQSCKGRSYVRSIFPKLVTIDLPNVYICGREIIHRDILFRHNLVVLGRVGFNSFPYVYSFFFGL